MKLTKEQVAVNRHRIIETAGRLFRKQFICRWNSLLFQAAYATASANSIRSITIATLTCLMHA
jgi:hypothetical protein